MVIHYTVSSFIFKKFKGEFIMITNISSEYIKILIENCEKYKSLAEKAITQISDEDLHFQPDKDSNSIAVIMQHLSGNLRSRFTEFFATDGEKKTRDRDAEFEDQNFSRQNLMNSWNDSWGILLNLLKNLKEDDLLKEVKIRGEIYSAFGAFERSLAHTAYHVGQIVQLAKMIKREDWQTLSIAKGKSKDFNKQKNFTG
jgi:Protein of unknown function (DUF1572)